MNRISKDNVDSSVIEAQLMESCKKMQETKASISSNETKNALVQLLIFGFIILVGMALLTPFALWPAWINALCTILITAVALQANALIRKTRVSDNRCRRLTRILVACGLLSWAWLVWPTPWAYGVDYWESPFEGDSRRFPVRVRTNRFTGEKQNQGGPAGEWGRFVW